MLGVFCLILISNYVLADSFSSAINSPTVPNLGALEPIANYGTDISTGAFYYTYNITVAKGTNNLTPTVDLLYNSQSVKGQPSVIGSGWTLTETYIQRDVNGTATNTSDDRFLLKLNGRNYELYYNSSEDQWHTKIESFLQINNLTSSITGRQYFRVRTTDGTTYTLGNSNESELRSNLYNYTVRWYPNQVTDAYQNRITYYYSKNPNIGDSGAVYLTTIEYNLDNRRRVEFTYLPRVDVRTSYKNGNMESYADHLSSITIKVNTTGTWNEVRHYQLSYINYDAVSLLKNITVYGNDSITSLPPVTFEYYNNTGWNSQNDPWNLSTNYSFQDINNSDTGIRLIDLNGDGLVDLIQRSNTQSAVLINNGSGQNTNTGIWNLSLKFAFSNNGVDTGVRTVDLNGDGRVDIIKQQNCTSENCSGVLLNNGNGWTVSNMWNLNTNFAIIDNNNFSNGVEFADLNGDGLNDVIKRQNCTGITCDAVVLNNGSGWTNSTGVWNLPIDYAFVSSGIDQGVRLVDLNGDGLVDVIKRQNCNATSCSGVLLNNGNGWTNTSSWTLPIDYALTNFGNDTGVRFVDLNGDGLVDVIKSQNCNATTCSGVLLNTGSGWKNDTGLWNISANMGFVNGSANKAVRLTDLNGDGVADVFKRDSCNTTNCTGTWQNNAQKNYLLYKVHYAYGGTTIIDYTSSSNPTFNNTGGDNIYDLPIAIPVVATIQTLNGFNDNRSVQGLSSYTRGNGAYKFDRTSSEFRGFGITREITPANNTIVHHYFQTDTLQGLEFETDEYNGSTILLRNTTHVYTTTPVSGVTVVKMVSTRIDEWDGTASSRSLVTNYTYDAYGNIASISNYGDTAVLGDESFTLNNYEYHTDTWIVNAKTSTTLLDSDDITILRQTNYTNNVQGSPINITSYLSGYTVITTLAYDSYGNIISRIDPRRYTTNYEYENVTNTYLSREINPLAQATVYDYNIGNGNLNSKADPNGYTTSYTYDIFGRLNKTILPLDDVNSPTTQYTYNFDGITPENIVITKKVNSTLNLTQYYYFDGREKIVQIKITAKNGLFSTTDFIYDAMNHLNATSNPYYTINQSYTDLNATNYYTRNDYDALDRLTKITHADNTYSTNIYNKAITSRIDERSHQRNYTSDARENITKIVEYNNGQMYNTTYQYDGAGQLLLINDTDGNTFRFAYDTLGRKISMIDPDMGTWNYTYDVNGNLVAQRDNRGVITNFIYDGLNRVTTKNSTNISFTYTYDVNVKGPLSTLQSASANISYGYDSRLRVVQENITINGIIYSTTYQYNSMDNITSKTLPNQQSINYTYNIQGLLDTVPGFITNITYNANNNALIKSLNNGLFYSVNYYSDTLRIKNINTGSIQNISYAYDPTGNIVSIVDAVEATTTNMTYDDLQRIHTAKKTNSTVILWSYNYSIDGKNVIKTIISDLQTISFGFSASPAHSPTQVNVTTMTLPQLLYNYTFTNSNEGFTLNTGWNWDNATGSIFYNGTDFNGTLISPNDSLRSYPSGYNITIMFTTGDITNTKFYINSPGDSLVGDRYNMERANSTYQHFKHDGGGYSSTDDYLDGVWQTISIVVNLTSNTTRACHVGGSCTNIENMSTYTPGDYFGIIPGTVSGHTINITRIEVWRIG